jgi:chemotaxis signal transduction protein
MEATETNEIPSSAAHASDAEAAIRHIVVEVCGDAYGVTTEHTVELVTAASSPITRVPHAQDFVAGVVNHRGTIIPVIDITVLLQLRSKSSVDESERMLVVTEFEGLKAALLVDRVSYVADCNASNIEPLPDSTDQAGFVTGLVQRADAGFILILDLHAVFAHACADR